MNQYQKLYTAQDSAIAFIDHQPQMLFGVASLDRASLMNNVTLLAKVAKEYNIPTVLSSVETESFSGYVWPQLLDVFPGKNVIERTSMNSWDSMEFRKAIEATGRKNILICGLWTEVCVTWPTIEMLGVGYNVYVVEDCCGATSPAAHEAALRDLARRLEGASRPRVLYWANPHTAGADTAIGALIEAAGAENVGKTLGLKGIVPLGSERAFRERQEPGFLIGDMVQGIAHQLHE